MIIDADYIRKFRPVAKNIEPDRIAIYIGEAEKLDILPAIGAEMYQRFSQLGEIVVKGKDGTMGALLTEDGENIYALSEGDLETNEFKLLNGGYYTDRCGGLRHFEGIKTALAYLAYARLVRGQAAQVTPFGVVQKVGDDSTPVDSRGIAATASDAERIGREYLAESVRFWQESGKDDGTKPQKPAKRTRRFVAIGD